MRQIDWSKALSEEDIAWLRTTGIVGIEDRIARNAEEHNSDVPDPEIPADETTRNALDATVRGSERVVSNNGPQEIDPTDSTDDEEVEYVEDDYESWKVAELEREVNARDQLPDTTACTVEGTGANGKVTKPDLVKALRVWDQENPDALKD